MSEERGILRQVTYLGLTLERGTERVPDDGRYYVLRDGEVINSAKGRAVADLYLDEEIEAIHDANPSLKRPRDLIMAERAFNEIIKARGESRAAARSKAAQKGGKGGRGGV